MINTTTPEIQTVQHAAPSVVPSHGQKGTHRTKFNFALTSLVLAGSLLVSILLLEGCLAAAGVGEEEYLKRDAALGWVMMPNKHITWRHEGYSVTQVNSAGMLEREFPLEKSKDTLRIAVIGDSYTEALQVPREQNYCRVLESSLATDAKAKGKTIEVLNFGISAYNVAQIYMRLKDLAVKYNPDIVVLAESVDATRYLSPDGESFFRARPIFTLNDKNELVSDYTKQNKWLECPDGVRVRSTAWLREHSHIWGVVAKAAEQVAMFWQGLENGEKKFGEVVTKKKTSFDTAKGPACVNGIFIDPVSIYSPRLPSVDLPHKQEALTKWWPVHAELLRQMKNECSSIGAEFVILRLPQVNAYNNVRETNLLKEFATANGVQFIDTTQTFIDYDNKYAPLFYDPHLSANGHRLIAQQLAKELALVVEAKLESK